MGAWKKGGADSLSWICPSLDNWTERIDPPVRETPRGEMRGEREERGSRGEGRGRSDLTVLKPWLSHSFALKTIVSVSQGQMHGVGECLQEVTPLTNDTSRPCPEHLTYINSCNFSSEEVGAIILIYRCGVQPREVQ